MPQTDGQGGATGRQALRQAEAASEHRVTPSRWRVKHLPKDPQTCNQLWVRAVWESCHSSQKPIKAVAMSDAAKQKLVMRIYMQTAISPCAFLPVIWAVVYGWELDTPMKSLIQVCIFLYSSWAWWFVLLFHQFSGFGFCLWGCFFRVDFHFTRWYTLVELKSLS